MVRRVGTYFGVVIISVLVFFFLEAAFVMVKNVVVRSGQIARVQCVFEFPTASSVPRIVGRLSVGQDAISGSGDLDVYNVRSGTGC
jgi:hypothetical protein